MVKRADDVAAEFGEFIQEQYAMVGEGDFAGAGVGAAADESGVGDGVVWCAERSGGDQGLAGGRAWS